MANDCQVILIFPVMSSALLLVLEKYSDVEQMTGMHFTSQKSLGLNNNTSAGYLGYTLVVCLCS